MLKNQSQVPMAARKKFSYIQEADLHPLAPIIEQVEYMLTNRNKYKAEGFDLTSITGRPLSTVNNSDSQVSNIFSNTNTLPNTNDQVGKSSEMTNFNTCSTSRKSKTVQEEHKSVLVSPNAVQE